MKLLSSSTMSKSCLLIAALWLGSANATPCSSHNKKNNCESASGCYWIATGNGQFAGSCHAEAGNPTGNENHPESICDASANNANQCEGDDDKCIFVNDKGTKTCTEVNRGTAGDGELCQMYLTDDDGVDIWMEKENHGCQDGFICTLNDDFVATSIGYGVDVDGTCVPTSCNGKKVPGNCNGNIANKDQCEATTQRVTICHRTCSAKNPWVRITIDEDAWSGQGCGHQLQHDIRDDCANKAPWTEWGVNRKDYPIKFHGTRQHVADINNFNANQEREYWRRWEPACPYVRNGACCDWNDPENPCCGEENPQPIYPDLTIKKYAGPASAVCGPGIDYDEWEDVSYTLPTGSSTWKYCYVITVGPSECLFNVKMIDDAPLGGTDGWLWLTQYSTGNPDDAQQLCPEDGVTYISGPSVTGQAPEGPYDAVVFGTGVLSLQDCGDQDPAKVVPPTPTPKPTPAPVAAPTLPPVPPGECPYVTLDFTSLTNPMAGYYGQTTNFKAGDYLYDQLWWSHGVKVSARIKSTSHKTSNNPFIPKFNPATGNWEDDKPNQDPNDRTSGGAVRLFDTLHPTKATGQDLCGSGSGEGDPDLGAPNGECPGGGPGHGPGGEPFLADGVTPNPWKNCDPLGLVSIIQETDKDCPDDTGRGGYITITFREPTKVALTSLLDIDEGNTPDITLIDENGIELVTLDTTATGDNGLFPLNIDTNQYPSVSMVDIFYDGSGSINSLVYQYCPEEPTPEIVIKKYAGPPDLCDENNFGSMVDDEYTLPLASDQWAYCYVISVPDNAEECVYDVSFTDPSTAAGTTEMVTQPYELLCPGDVVYVQGDTQPGSEAPDGPDEAVVTGTGQYSGQEVTDQDPASVVVYEEIPTLKPTPSPVSPTPAPVSPTPAPVEPTPAPVSPTPAPVSPTPAPAQPTPAPVSPTPAPVSPTPAPVEPSPAPAEPSPAPVSPTPAPVGPSPAPVESCPPGTDPENPGSEYCPGDSGVVPLAVQGTPTTADDLDILFDIVPNFSTVKFKVQSPFVGQTKLFVKYDAPAGNAGAWSHECDSFDCGETTEYIEADCVEASGQPVTLVQLYFVDANSVIDEITGDITIDECCVPGDVPPNAVAQYSFMIRCSCPTAGGRRRLRSVRDGEVLEEPEAFDVEAAVAMFKSSHNFDL